MINKPLVSLLSLSSLTTITSTSTTNKPTSNYVSRGVFSFSDFRITASAIVGDSPSTIAFSDSVKNLVRLTKISEDGVIAVGQELKSDIPSSTIFGTRIDLYAHPKEGNHLLVADSDLGYFYSGDDWNTWSLQQVLTPPTGLSTSGSFANHVRIDRKSYNKLVVSCDTCGVSPIEPYIPTGQVYLYESDPHYKSWSQTTVLEAVQTSSPFFCTTGPFTGYSVFLGQSDVRISDKNVLASTAYTNCAVGGAILFSKRGSQWSQQQTFWDRNAEYGSLAIEGDTIVIGAISADYGATSNVGAVYIQYPNTPEYGVKPEPGIPTQWSLHQILYPPAPVADSLFGSDLTVTGNSLYIGSNPLNSIFYYKRETLNGYWSLQQTLTVPALSGVASHQVFGTSVLAIGQKGPDLVSTIFENNYDWNCLIVSLEDQFGDGWDTARLQITTPTGETSYASPFCSSSNPFEFRYCPRFGTSDYEGMYRFTITDGPKAKFFWEIQWRVYEEKTGQWYRGNHATRMDFHFDADDLEFTHRGIVHDLPLNITCVTCPGKPQEKSDKPKPKTRRLKDETLAPTISPAPTLGQTITSGETWRYLTLSTTGEPWFDNQHQGTNYYISDTQGHRLLSTGTSCTTLSSQCYQNIPDGQYVLRVGGGLNNYHDDHKWTFCGRVGGAEEQLNFVVKNGECDAIASYTRATYCSTVLHATLLLSVQLEMFGISETTSVELLNEADLMALSDSISSIVGHGVLASDVRLNTITNQYGHAIFDVTVGVDAANFGADPHDLDSMENVVSDVSSIFNNAASSGRLNSALKSTTIQNAQFFQKLDGVQVIDTVLVSVNPHADTLVHEMVTDMVQESTVNEVETSSYSKTFYLMVAGYLASVVAVIALAVYAYTQVRSSSPSSTTATSLNTQSTKMDISTTKDSSAAVINPVVSASVATTTPATSSSVSTKQQPLRVVDSTKKSQRMNTIMIADLIQMVKEVSLIILIIIYDF